MEPQASPESLGKEKILPLPSEIRCCYESCELLVGKTTVPSLRVCKASSAKGTSLFPLLSPNSLQERVAPTAPPCGPGFLHPAMELHSATWQLAFFFLARDHFPAQTGQQKWETPLAPPQSYLGSPIITAAPRKISYFNTQPLNCPTFAIQVQRSSTTSLLCALLMPQVSLEGIHTELLGCLKQETAMLLHLSYSVENCLHQGHFDS